ncbi:MAG: TM2 domain-containing protein [Brevinema sp.]
MAFCLGCGVDMSSEAFSCPRCGKPTNVRMLAMGGKSRMTAILFTLFLGGVGGHKFYLGERGKGFLFLLFSWTLIPSFLALIDLILLIGMSEEKFCKMY